MPVAPVMPTINLRAAGIRSPFLPRRRHVASAPLRRGE